MKEYIVKIYYRDGKKETVYAEDYRVKDGCLAWYRRFGEGSGTHYIPLDLIKEFVVD